MPTLFLPEFPNGVALSQGTRVFPAYYTTDFKTPILVLFQVHLDIQVGEHAVDYANVAHKDKLSELQLRIRQLLDQVHQITKEQSYQRVSYTLCNCFCAYYRHKQCG